jgi:hypothetical protein
VQGMRNMPRFLSHRGIRQAGVAYAFSWIYRPPCRPPRTPVKPIVPSA